MSKKKRLGIFLLAVAVIFALLYAKKSLSRTEDETRTPEVTEQEPSIPTEMRTELQGIASKTTQNITENITEAESITINIYNDEPVGAKTFDVHFPEEDILSIVDNDREGLNEEVQAFVNGYGYRDAIYADYAGDVAINSYDKTVTLTYYLKYKRKEAVYFYLKYNKKTKQWSSRLA